MPPSFTTVTPAEGAGAWTVWTQGTLATTTSAAATLAAGAVMLGAPAPVARTDLGAGTIAVTLTGTPGNAADHAELIVSNDGGTVAVVDVTAQLATHGGSTSIAVPSGNSTAVPAVSVYGVALRTWIGATETTSARWTRASTPVDLSTSASASVSLTLP